MKLLAVNFHYFREEKYQGGIYPVSESQFSHQLEVLSEYYQFVGQSDINSWIHNNHYPEGNYCVITFDDGLKEQMNAFSWLQKNSIPAIFYVATQPLTDKCVLDVHKIHYIRTRLSDQKLLSNIELLFPEKVKSIDFSAASTQYRYDNKEGQAVKYLMNFGLEENEKQHILHSCFNELIEDEAAFSEQLYMNKADLTTLAESGMLGAHGHKHIPLAQIEYKSAQEDIITCVDYLETQTGTKITSFTYPYGSKVAVNESLLPIFSSTHIHFAFTMWRGVNKSASGIQPLLLQRVDTNDAPGGKNNSLDYLP